MSPLSEVIELRSKDKEINMKSNYYFNTPEEESGAPAESPEEIRANTVSPQEHIRRLKSSGDPVLIARADEWEEGLVKGKSTQEIVSDPGKERIKELWSNLPKLDVTAYGGIEFGLRRQGDVGFDIPKGLMGDRYNVSKENVVYGVGTQGEKKFIILRSLLNTEIRSGTPYTILLDFGDEVWESVNWNYALVIQKILEDKELSDKIFHHPEELEKTDFKSLANVEWKTISQNTQLLNTILNMALGRSSTIFGEETFTHWPKPAEFARALEQLNPDQRKGLTWLIGGSKPWQQQVAINVIYDPAYGDHYPDSLKI